MQGSMDLKPDQTVECQEQIASDKRKKEVAVATALANLQETGAINASLPYSELLTTSLVMSALKISQRFPLVPMFPEILMNVLEDEKNRNVIDWNSNGMSFIIKNSNLEYS